MERAAFVRGAVLLCLGGAVLLAPPVPARETGGTPAVKARPETTLPQAEVQQRLKRYTPAQVGAPPGRLDAKATRLVKKLVESSEAMDLAFWHQVSEDGCRLRDELQGTSDPVLADYGAFLRIQYGPWDRLADNEPFLGRAPKPDGANFYPADFSRREMEQWLTDHPKDRESFTSPYTVIRRDGAGLVSLPYSKYFAEHLGPAAAALREAAGLADCAPLAKFLKARAEAFGKDDYYASDLLWMETGTCPVDIAIGPYEFYEDRLLGYKTAFSAVVTVRDDEATARFNEISKWGKELLANLPLPDELRDRVELVKSSPVTVADEIFAAGDARAGFQIRAFVLPNDERVRVARGTKHVILKNVIDARFHSLVEPLAQVVLTPEQAAQVSDEAYMDIVLMWQLAHGFSPKPILLPGGGSVPPRILLRQRHSIIEAARAEAVSLMNALYLVREKVLPPTLATTIPITHLASLFESFRYGTLEAHGLAKLMVYNYLSANGAYRYDPTLKRFFVDYDRLDNALRNLVAELLTIEITGDYARAGHDVLDYGIVPGEVRAKLAELKALPIDILPNYTILAR